MDRANHYEAAFEAYLQERHTCYVAVDEMRRSYLGEQRVKSLDFIVHGEGEDGSRLLVDVKGRRFPSGAPGHERRIWENWSTEEDVEGLEHWAGRFGPGYCGLLVFAYHLAPTIALPDDTLDLWCWRGKRYLIRAVEVDDYRRHMRVRSPKWETVSVPQAAFRRLVRPFQFFVDPSGVLVES